MRLATTLAALLATTAVTAAGLAAAAACQSESRGQGQALATSKSQDQAPVNAPANAQVNAQGTAAGTAPSNATRSAPMQAGFEKAHASFRDHAARVLKLAPDRVLVSPIEADLSVQLDQRVGAAWAFYGSAKDHPDRQVRGWAVADGSVITPEQNLGLLLAEAGAWTDRPALDASALAERLAWAMGMNHRVVGPRSLHVEPSGKGTLSFQVAYRPPGPAGGAGGGRDRISQCTVALTADHHAKLTTTAVTAPAAPAID
jgi:hypothetical protein